MLGGFHQASDRSSWALCRPWHNRHGRWDCGRTGKAKLQADDLDSALALFGDLGFPVTYLPDPLSGNVADGKVLGKAGQKLIRVLRSHVLLVLFGGHSMISFSPGSEPTPMRPVASPEPRLSSCALPFPRGPGSSVAAVSEGDKERPHLGARLPWQIGASPPHEIRAIWHGRSALKATSIDIAARAASPGSSLQRIPKSHSFFQFTILSFADVLGCLGVGYSDVPFP